MYGGNYLTEQQRSLSLSGEQLKASQPTKSSKSPKFAGAFADTVRASTGALEQEYIKSLQQQVYLLELENNHLRSQAVKATDLHPAMAAEAERMLQELKTQQAKVDALQLENYRKEGAAEILQQKVTSLTARLAQYEESHQQEREHFTKDTTELRHEREMHQRDASRLQLKLNELQDDHDKRLADLKGSETKVAHLRSELEAVLDRLSAADSALTDERGATARLEARVKVLELELANSSSKALERSLRELRSENSFLKDRLRKQQGKAHDETLLRTKNSEEASALVKQNAALEQRLVQLEKQLEAERDKSSQWATHVHSGGDELLRLRERERTLEYQVARGVEEVAQLRLRTQQLSQQLQEAEVSQNAGSLSLTVTRQRLDDTQSSQSALAAEVESLRRDKSELVQYVDSLQLALKERESEKEGLRGSLDKTELRLTEMQAEVNRLQQLQATRWSEVEKMADTLRSAAHSNSMLYDRY